MLYGQIIVGPPGSGKSTYCERIGQILGQIGRKVCIINLDPANFNTNYKSTIDINDLISLDDVMKHYKLGPNGGLLYCIDFVGKY
eukprot:UN04654